MISLPSSPSKAVNILPWISQTLVFSLNSLISIWARTYFFRSDFYEWPDSHSQDILAHTAHAIKPGYPRLLIEDMPEGIERTKG